MNFDIIKTRFNSNVLIQKCLKKTPERKQQKRNTTLETLRF